MVMFVCPNCSNAVPIGGVMPSLVCNRKACRHWESGNCNRMTVELDNFGVCREFVWKNRNEERND